MFVMHNAVRDYAWGSRTQLAELLGRPAPGHPEAELWIGAHEGDPSRLPDGRTLDEAITAAPAELLGERAHATFGARLPFLMKVLAVEQPLSLQVHPSAERARLGHAREEAAGIPLTAAHRTYQDRAHKPELVFALTRFEGLAGFRHVERTVEILRLLRHPWAERTATRLLERRPGDALRAVVTDALALEGRPLRRVLRDLADAARHAGARAGRSRSEAEAARALTRFADLVGTYPADPGVLVTLLLNHVVLAPGEAMFLDAGMVHAYLEGLAVEIMASSDNVLRAGLTPKHRDVPELLSATDFAPVGPPRWAPSERTGTFTSLEPPVAEFCLTVGRPPLRRVPSGGPRALLVLEGAVDVVGGEERLRVRRGQSVFVGHDDGPVEVVGDGRVAIGSVPA